MNFITQNTQNNTSCRTPFAWCCAFVKCTLTRTGWTGNAGPENERAF